jgi:hypothetical protein
MLERVHFNWSRSNSKQYYDDKDDDDDDDPFAVKMQCEIKQDHKVLTQLHDV